MNSKPLTPWNTMTQEEQADYLNRFTTQYRTYEVPMDDKQSIFNREIDVLSLQIPVSFASLEEDEIFAGRRLLPPIGFSPQEGGLGFYINEDSWKEFYQSCSESLKSTYQLDDLYDFWLEYNTSEKIRKAYSPEMAAMLTRETEIFYENPLIGAGLFRMGGAHPNYDELVRLGIPGLKAKVSHQIEISSKGTKLENSDFLQGLLKALDLFENLILSYSQEAEDLSRSSVNRTRKAELDRLATGLRAIASRAPTSLFEGIQLIWLYSLLSGALNYGRLDEALGDLLQSDLSKNLLTNEEAIELLIGFWNQINKRKNTWDARIILGGKGRRNPDNADAFALLALETTKRVHEPLPQLTLRMYQGQNEDLFQKAYEVISTNNPYPMLYNDDVNIPALSQVFRISEQEAEHYLPYGCGEFVLNHRSFGTPSGILNLPMALESVLNQGWNFAGTVPFGYSPIPINDQTTFDDLWQSYTAKVEEYVDILAHHEALEYEMTAKEAGFLFLSLLYDDCITQNKPLFGGGIRYLCGTLESYGNTNVSDSLHVINQLVFQQKNVSLTRFVQALQSDFSQDPELLQQIQNIPKYGNDDEQADAMFCKVHNHICNYTLSLGPQVGLHAYSIVIINNSANTQLGKHTGASADGRKSGDSLANGNAAHAGNDKKGIIPLLNSLVKPDPRIHGGAVQNLKLSRETMVTYPPKCKALIDTYFLNGGTQLMITSIGKGELEDAYLHPENWPNLLVRVGGFSARFVELEKAVQYDILQRTFYE